MISVGDLMIHEELIISIWMLKAQYFWMKGMILVFIINVPSIDKEKYQILRKKNMKQR